MRRGGVVGVATRAPAGEASENFCAAFPRGLLGFDHEHRRAFAQGHPSARRVEWAAARSVHEQQGMESAPRHPRERIRATGEHHVGIAVHDEFRRRGDGERAGRARGGEGHAWAEQPEVVGDDVHSGMAFVEARGAGAHFTAFDERGEKVFAVERATDGAAERDAGAVGEGWQIYFGIGESIARGEPAEFVATRTAIGCAERDEVFPDFADGNLAVARGLKEAQRFQPARAGGDGLPDFLRAAARRGHDAETGDDRSARGH